MHALARVACIKMIQLQNMARLFLSTSYATQIDSKTGQIRVEFREFIEQLLSSLRNIDGLHVFCAVEDDDWFVSEEPPEVSIKKDLNEVKAADILVAILLPDVGSAGVHFEMGVAYALGKNVFAATELGTELRFFDQGAANAGYIAHIRYKDAFSLAEQIKAVL